MRRLAYLGQASYTKQPVPYRADSIFYYDKGTTKRKCVAQKLELFDYIIGMQFSIKELMEKIDGGSINPNQEDAASEE